MVSRPAVFQQQQQAAEGHSAAEQAVEVRVAAGDERLAVQTWARAGICRQQDAECN